MATKFEQPNPKGRRDAGPSVRHFNRKQQCALLSCRLDVVAGGTPVKQSLTTMSRQTTKTLYDRYATLRKLLESLRSYLHLSQSNLASRIRWEGERELLPQTYTTSPLSKYFPCPPAVAFPSNGTMSRAKQVLLLLVFIVAFQHIHTHSTPPKGDVKMRHLKPPPNWNISNFLIEEGRDLRTRSQAKGQKNGFNCAFSQGAHAHFGGGCFIPGGHRNGSPTTATITRPCGTILLCVWQQNAVWWAVNRQKLSVRIKGAILFQFRL